MKEKRTKWIGIGAIIAVCLASILTVILLILDRDTTEVAYTYENVPEFCYSASFDEVESKGFTLVPSRYIEFVNRDENIDFDTKMKTLQSELKDLLVAEEKSKADLLSVFKELGYEIEL